METRIGAEIGLASELLKNNEVIGVPTETVYGLAGLVSSSEAINKIFKVKNRPSYDPLIVHAFNHDQILSELSLENQKEIVKLSKAFWPGPLTLVVRKKPGVSDVITAGLPSVAVRIPNHPTFLALLKEINEPLAAPSANPFGYVSPTTSGHVFDQLSGKIPYILEGGDCEVGLESTILDLSRRDPIILRKGLIQPEEIEGVLNQKVSYHERKEKLASPGNFEKHYSPNTPILRFKNGGVKVDKTEKGRTGYILYKSSLVELDMEDQIILSEKGDLREAARNLYAALRKMDSRGYQEIRVELVPNEGLGIAINDRIERATKIG